LPDTVRTSRIFQEVRRKKAPFGENGDPGFKGFVQPILVGAELLQAGFRNANFHLELLFLSINVGRYR